MSDQPLPLSPVPPPTQPAPPTQPRALPVAQPVTKWPTVFGVIGIIFGVLGMLGVALELASLLMTPLMARGMAAENVALIQKVRGLTTAAGAVRLSIAILLLVSGIGLISRRRWSVSSTKVWAVLKILAAVAGGVLGFWIQNALFQRNLTVAGTPPGYSTITGSPASFVRALQLFGLLLNFVWSCTLPVVLLIWLARPKVKAEVATWS